MVTLVLLPMGKIAPRAKTFLCLTAFPRPKLPQGYFHGYVKKNMTVPELKSTVYLLPEVAWPIITQIVANTGNHAVL